MNHEAKLLIEKIINLYNSFLCNFFYGVHYWNEKYINGKWERICLRCNKQEIFINNDWIKKNNP